MMQSNFKIAVTGGIGSGKSTAVDIIKDLGYPVYSCDQITAELYENQKVLKGLKNLFPTAIKGFFKLKADKKEISKIVFNDLDKRKELNDFLMPLILDALFNNLNKENGLVFAEVPLLYETNLQNEFDQVFVITRDMNTRIDSVMKRSNLTKEQVVSRINAQFDYENFTATSEIVITNDGDIENLKAQILNAVETAKKNLIK